MGVCQQLLHQIILIIYINLTMKVFCVLICLFAAASAKCSVDSEVRFILNNFSKTAVTKNVDCVVGQGPCDSLGRRLKMRHHQQLDREDVENLALVNKFR